MENADILDFLPSVNLRPLPPSPLGQVLIALELVLEDTGILTALSNAPTLSSSHITALRSAIHRINRNSQTARRFAQKARRDLSSQSGRPVDTGDTP